MTQTRTAMAYTGFKAALAIVSVAGLAACAVQNREPVAVSQTKPSITYSYVNDQGLVDATRKAETFCTTYNAWPSTQNIYTQPEGGRNVTFVCDQPRVAAAVSPAPMIVTAPAPQPMVSYTYRDDRGLVDATGTAARYCAGFAAQARSTVVQNNTDGSKTIGFECVRTM